MTRGADSHLGRSMLPLTIKRPLSTRSREASITDFLTIRIKQHCLTEFNLTLNSLYSAIVPKSKTTGLRDCSLVGGMGRMEQDRVFPLGVPDAFECLLTQSPTRSTGAESKESLGRDSVQSASTVFPQTDSGYTARTSHCPPLSLLEMSAHFRTYRRRNRRIP